MSDVTYTFGAEDQGVAAAARRLEQDFSRAEKAGNRLHGSTTTLGRAVGVLGQRALGSAASFAKLGVAGLVVGAGYAAWHTASKGITDWMQASEQGRNEMTLMEAKAKVFSENLGQYLGRLGGDIGLAKPAQVLMGGLNDAFGSNPEAQKVRAAEWEKSARMRQELTLARDDGEREFLTLLEREEQLYKSITSELTIMRDSGAISGPDFGRFMRRERSEHDKRSDEIYAEENRRRGEALRREREVTESGSRAFEDQTRAVFERQEAERQSLEFAEAEAEIDRLQAVGLEKEAQAERVRLDTMRKIVELKKLEFVTDAARSQAIDKILRSQADQLNSIGANSAKDTQHFRYTGSQVLSPGAWSSVMGRQVFGTGDGAGFGATGSPSRSESVTRKLDTQITVLKSIERKIEGVGGLSP